MHQGQWFQKRQKTEVGARKQEATASAGHRPIGKQLGTSLARPHCSEQTVSIKTITHVMSRTTKNKTVSM